MNYKVGSRRLFVQRFLVILILFVTIGGWGQVLEKKEIPFLTETSKSSASIENVFSDKGQILVSLVLSENFNERNRSLDKEIQIKTSDGKDFVMDKNQYPIGYHENVLYSYTNDFENQQRVYTVQPAGQGLSARKKTLTLSFSSTVRVLNSGDMIITEGGHSGRDWASLYSSGFEELHRFQPFNDESSIAYAANKDYITYVGQIATDSVIRVGLYSAAMFKKVVSIEQVEIEANHLVSSVALGQNNVLVLLTDIDSGFNQILVLDKQLRKMNKIKLQERVSHNKLITLAGKIFFSTAKNIQCFDMQKGTKEWSYKRSNTNAVKTEKGYRFYGGELFALDQENLVLLEGLFEDGQLEVKDVSLKVLSYETGVKLQEDKLGDFSDEVSLKKDQNTISIFSKNKIVVYEKK